MEIPILFKDERAPVHPLEHDQEDLYPCARPNHGTRFDIHQLQLRPLAPVELTSSPTTICFTVYRTVHKLCNLNITLCDSTLPHGWTSTQVRTFWMAGILLERCNVSPGKAFDSMRQLLRFIDCLGSFPRLGRAGGRACPRHSMGQEGGGRTRPARVSGQRLPPGRWHGSMAAWQRGSVAAW